MIHYNIIGYLSLNDLWRVQNSVWEARTKWYNLGLGLGITADSLDAIELVNVKTPDRCFRAMLTQWLRQDSPKPTWRALIEALRSPSVDESVLAQDIAESSATPPTTQNEPMSSASGQQKKIGKQSMALPCH